MEYNCKSGSKTVFPEFMLSFKFLTVLTLAEHILKLEQIPDCFSRLLNLVFALCSSW